MVVKNWKLIIYPILTEIQTFNKEGNNNMNEFYEKKNISLASEVQEAYEYAAKNNIKFYRATTEKGEYFGWEKDKYVKAKAGQEWFENPNYIEQQLNAEADILPVEPTESIVEEIIKDTTYIEPIVAIEEKVDYKALYEEQCKVLKATKDELKNWIDMYDTVNKELDSIKNAFAVIVKELKEAEEKTE